jgi:endonuclease YncB( thermonuclease family)
MGNCFGCGTNTNIGEIKEIDNISDKKETKERKERKEIDNVSDIDTKLIQLNNSTYTNTPEQVYRFLIAKVIKVYDGDTFWISAWHNNEICRFSLRLYGCDCAEMRGGTPETKKLAIKAKEFVVDAIGGKIINVNILNGKRYDGKVIHEKYGRLLGTVHYNGKNLTDELIKAGLAQPYAGGKKLNWDIDNTKVVEKMDDIKEDQNSEV